MDMERVFVVFFILHEHLSSQPMMSIFIDFFIFILSYICVRYCVTFVINELTDELLDAYLQQIHVTV